MSSPKNAFLVTGPPGCGKTTVLLKTADRLRVLGYSVGGVVTGEIREGSTRVGFQLTDLLTQESGVMAHVRLGRGIVIGRYRVNSETLESLGRRALERAVTDADAICCDEFGPMELTSPGFLEAAARALGSGKPFIGSIHYRIHHPVLRELRLGVEILEVTQANRENMPDWIVSKLRLQKR